MVISGVVADVSPRHVVLAILDHGGDAALSRTVKRGKGIQPRPLPWPRRQTESAHPGRSSGPDVSPGTCVGPARYTAVARGTVFEGAHHEGADFRETALGNARLTGAWIERARFDRAHDVPTNVARLLHQSGQVPEGQGSPVTVHHTRWLPSCGMTGCRCACRPDSRRRLFIPWRFASRGCARGPPDRWQRHFSAQLWHRSRWPGRPDAGESAIPSRESERGDLHGGRSASGLLWPGRASACSSCHALTSCRRSLAVARRSASTRQRQKRTSAFGLFGERRRGESGSVGDTDGRGDQQGATHIAPFVTNREPSWVLWRLATLRL